MNNRMGRHLQRQEMQREGRRNASLMAHMTPAERRKFIWAQLCGALIASLVTLGIILVCSALLYFVRTR